MSDSESTTVSDAELLKAMITLGHSDEFTELALEGVSDEDLLEAAHYAAERHCGWAFIEAWAHTIYSAANFQKLAEVAAHYSFVEGINDMAVEAKEADDGPHALDYARLLASAGAFPTRALLDLCVGKGVAVPDYERLAERADALEAQAARVSDRPDCTASQIYQELAAAQLYQESTAAQI